MNHVSFRTKKYFHWRIKDVQNPSSTIIEIYLLVHLQCQNCLFSLWVRNRFNPYLRLFCGFFVHNFQIGVNEKIWGKLWTFPLNLHSVNDWSLCCWSNLLYFDKLFLEYKYSMQLNSYKSQCNLDFEQAPCQAIILIRVWSRAQIGHHLIYELTRSLKIINYGYVCFIDY